MFKMKKKHINFPILSVFGKQGNFSYPYIRIYSGDSS